MGLVVLTTIQLQGKDAGRHASKGIHIHSSGNSRDAVNCGGSRVDIQATDGALQAEVVRKAAEKIGGNGKKIASCFKKHWVSCLTGSGNTGSAVCFRWRWVSGLAVSGDTGSAILGDTGSDVLGDTGSDVWLSQVTFCQLSVSGDTGSADSLRWHWISWLSQVALGQLS